MRSIHVGLINFMVQLFSIKVIIAVKMAPIKSSSFIYNEELNLTYFSWKIAEYWIFNGADLTQRMCSLFKYSSMTGESSQLEISLKNWSGFSACQVELEPKRDVKEEEHLNESNNLSLITKFWMGHPF